MPKGIYIEDLDKALATNELIHTNKLIYTEKPENPDVLISLVPTLDHDKHVAFNVVKAVPANGNKMVFYCVPANVWLNSGGLMGWDYINAEDTMELKIINADQDNILEIAIPNTRRVLIVFPYRAEDMPRWLINSNNPFCQSIVEKVSENALVNKWVKIIRGSAETDQALRKKLTHDDQLEEIFRRRIEVLKEDAFSKAKEEPKE